jgi:hypothetical protein
VTLLVNAAALQNGLPPEFQQTNGTPVTQGIQPVANNASPSPTYSAWTVNGYTVLDLTQFTSFNTASASPLLLAIRNTLPSSGFNCSAASVPFSTAEYTNADGNGAGLMGPFVPLVDYIDPFYLKGTKAPTQFALPDYHYCGVPPSTAPALNAPSLSPAPNYNCTSAGQFCLDWPNQFWQSNTTNTSPNLNCPITSTPQEPPTAIYFVATQFPTPALTWATDNSENCAGPDSAQQPNPCNQIVVQSPQTTEEPRGYVLQPAGPTWQPPLPVTIVGTGFGALPQPLPFAGYASSLVGAGNTQALTVSDDGEGAGGLAWSTNPASNAYTTACQVYIANWTDTSISLVLNLPVGLQDGYQTAGRLSAVLSPLSDFSPLSFAATPQCPVVAGDNLTFTLTNPQNGAPYAPPPIQVQASGTTLF